VVNEIRALVKENKPLIHCITNPISIHEVANVILSLSARPMMAENPIEVESITKTAGSLLLNLGNLTDARSESMKISAKTAGEYHIPFVLDICGVACLKNRRELALSIMQIAMPSVIKGNYSEIKALFDETYQGSGVDADETLSEKEMTKIVEILAGNYNTTLLSSGKVDIISNGKETWYCENGTEALTAITGTGCIQGAMCATFLSVADALNASLAASSVLGICGESAQTTLGNATFEANLLDRISTINDETINKYIKIKKIIS